MNAWSIARKDMRIFFQDRSAVLELLVLPLVFILIYVGVSSATGGGEEDTRILLPVANLDADGDKAAWLMERLEVEAGLRTIPVDLAEGRSQLDGGELDRLLTIPVGFSSDLSAGRQVSLGLKSAGNQPEEDRTVQLALEGVARDLSLEHQLLASLAQMAEMQGANPAAQLAFAPERVVSQARGQFEAARVRPLIAVSQIVPRSLGAREKSDFNPIQVSVPGMTVLFVFLTAQATARSIYQEKQTGSFRRLLAAPLSKPALLAGKMLPNLMTGLLQVVVVFGAAVLLFPLIGLERFSLGDQPMALALLVLVVVMCSTSVGVLIAALARTEAQIAGVSAVILWVAAFIGGSLVPLFLLGDALAALGRATPHGWANTAFYDVLVRGQGLAGISDGLLALLGFSALFFAIGVWRFEYR